MRVLGVIFLIFLILITLLHILANSLNKGYIILNQKLGKENELLKASILSIRSQLFLTTFKECSEEEKEKIIKECIDFVDEIEKVW